MAKTKKRARRQKTELDGVYFLKIVLYLIVGAQWIRFTSANGNTQVPIPVGLIIGVLFASHEHFQMDRKIEYALLLIAMFVGFWSQVGIYITM